MPKVQNGEFSINYEITIPGSGPTILLVAGLGEQIGSVEYPKEQCELFAKHGFRVVRMDNRECGFSTPTVEEDKIRPYSQLDMADDTAAVIRDLNCGPVHLVGASMGGFIVRWVALNHPALVKSLTVVMSGSGAVEGEDGPQLAQEAIAGLVAYAEPREREAQIEWNVAIWRDFLWGSGYPCPEDWVRERVAYAFDRSYNPAGTGRLLHGSVSSPSLLEAQSEIACPTLVMHGGEDLVFTAEHGETTASRIPGAELWLDPKMGHIMHEEQWEEMADRVATLAKSA